MVAKPGAASADALGKRTEAVESIAAALSQAPLTIVAVGPVTNIGSLVKLYPDLHDRIEKIVMVAARRPGPVGPCRRSGVERPPGDAAFCPQSKKSDLSVSKWRALPNGFI